MNREGKTYRHKNNDAIVLVIKTVRMSAGTSRHTVLILDPGTAATDTGKMRKAGDQVEVDEAPVQKWDRTWEDV
jgi:hypothetical protein